MLKQQLYSVMTAEEAAFLVSDGSTVAFSGFSPAGAAKVVPRALAERARSLHRKGEPFKLRVLTGASVDQNIDEELAGAEAISWRAPYQSDATIRGQINRQEVEYVDMHLSHVPQTVAFGFFGNIDFAVVEATEVTPDGRVYLTTSIGASPTYLKYADKVIIEINRHHSVRLREMADIQLLLPPPHRNAIPIFHPLTKSGWPYAVVDPKKIVAVVENEEPDHVASFAGKDGTSEKIASHVVAFLLDQLRDGRIPREFLPLQAGVGNTANAVMLALGEHSEIPPFLMYSEVFQDSLLTLMEEGRLLGASATSLTLTDPFLQRIYENMDYFIPRIVLRPQELSNNPGIIRRLGVIALNTALEMDIYGNVNSSHVFGTSIVNGIGGSGEFTRNSYLSFMMCPSIGKGGKVSRVVPMVPHVDNNEHSIQVVVTEQGLVDLRGLGPMQRARRIIEICAHPAYREPLYRYVENAKRGHIPHDLEHCYQWHMNLMKYGEMIPGLDVGGD
jgi:propionyl-CoA:succinyl-CoA transferase